MLSSELSSVFHRKETRSQACLYPSHIHSPETYTPESLPSAWETEPSEGLAEPEAGQRSNFIIFPAFNTPLDNQAARPRLAILSARLLLSQSRGCPSYSWSSQLGGGLPMPQGNSCLLHVTLAFYPFSLCHAQALGCHIN